MRKKQGIETEEKMKRGHTRNKCRSLLAAALAVLLFFVCLPLPVGAEEEDPVQRTWWARIAAGDFSMLEEEAQETRTLLVRTHGSLREYSDFIPQDINGDGREELLWCYRSGGDEPVCLLAAFANENNNVRMVLCTPQNASRDILLPSAEEEECYLVNGERILYLNHNTWTVSEVHCTEVLFDRHFDSFAGEGLSMYLVADEETYTAEVDAAVRRRLSFVDGRGVWYFRVPTGSETDEGIPIGADAFMAALLELTGRSFAQLLPAYETMRTGIERGVARHLYSFRTGLSRRDVFCSVAWPQIDADASSFSPAINAILKQEAFEMTGLFTDTEEGVPAEPEEVLDRYLADRASHGYGSDVRYRILHDDDTLVSVLFREEGSGRLKLLTVSKLNGRQIQIGDLTTTKLLSAALQKNSAEVFALEENLKRRREEETDGELIRKAFEETLASSEDWKSIGLDEQYLYLVLQEETQGAFLLRVPRWEAGVDSPGHMHLLTLHRAYPFLREVLDDAECLKVRRRAGGFDIDYRTMDGGSVSARLVNAEEEAGTFDSPEAARDYYMAQFADVTGFTTGSFLRQDAAAEEDPEHPDSRGRFYATETAFGEGGHALLTAGERAYELTQRCRSTRGGFLLREDDAQTDVEGMLRMEADGNGLWNNTKDVSRTLIRRLTEEKTVRIEFTKPVPRRIRMRIVPEAEGGILAETELELTELPPYRFADFNADGIDDLAVTVGEEERLFLYDDASAAFTAIPSLYEEYETWVQGGYGGVTFRYDAGTGYLLLLYSTEEDADYKRSLYLPEQPEEAVRELQLGETYRGDYRYEITDRTGERAETMLLLICAPDAPEAYDSIRFAEELFRSRYVFDERIARPDAGAEGEGETGAEGGRGAEVRVILGQLYRPDLFAPGYEYRLYLLEEGGTLLYTYDVPVTDLLTEVQRGTAEGKEALVLRFETGEVLTLPLDGLYGQD
ncbi:MAG: hypothetical protein IJR00_01105 [Lachnospiraceae bacterium]|nr:hypothetical protein [Lachnospiraceae bacterium]